MRAVFKISAGVILASGCAGQMWMHQAASPDFVQQTVAISRTCPALAAPARIGELSRAQAIMRRDAYWRTILLDAAYGAAGSKRDGCARRTDRRISA